MPNTFFGLNIGTLGVYAANVNLNVTANNVANRETEGYARQKATQQATRALRVHQKYGMIGSGVETTDISRVRDAYYDVKYQNNQTKLGESSSKYYYMLQIEDYFNESKVDGFTEQYGNLFDSLEDLQKMPDDITTRNAFLNNAQSLLEFIQKIKTDLGLVQQDLNAEVSSNVDRVNSIAAEIAALNKQINVVELTGAKANELRDRRELLLDSLSEIVAIDTSEKVYPNGKSEFTIRVGDNILVDDYDYCTLKVVTRKEAADEDDEVGLYDIEWSYGHSFNPIKEGLSGILKSLLEVRDGNNSVKEDNDVSYAIKYKGIPYYVNELNNFLDSFVQTFNDIHSKGTNLEGDSTADIPLFVMSDEGKYTVNPMVMKSPRLMATSYDITDGVGQYDLVTELINTKNARVYEGGTASEFLGALVTEIAVDTRKAKNLTTAYENMQTTIQNQRLSVMGVDTDEEAMNLVKYREAYNLSAKVISIMAEIYSKLINETGV